jgi:hypothetical protein
MPSLATTRFLILKKYVSTPTCLTSFPTFGKNARSLCRSLQARPARCLAIEDAYDWLQRGCAGLWRDWRSDSHHVADWLCVLCAGCVVESGRVAVNSRQSIARNISIRRAFFHSDRTVLGRVSPIFLFPPRIQRKHAMKHLSESHMDFVFSTPALICVAPPR